VFHGRVIVFNATFNSISVILLWSVLLVDETSENHRPVLRRFEDTKGTNRIRISKKNRQHNGRKKKYKGTNNDLQNLHIKLKIE
jgi:hypothetical protein